MYPITSARMLNESDYNTSITVARPRYPRKSQPAKLGAFQIAGNKADWNNRKAD